MAGISSTHLPGILIAGTGFLADQYDLAIIDLVKAVMKEVPEYATQTDADKGLVSATALWGAVCGQLFFGAFSDRIGRRLVFMMTAAMVIFGSLGSAFSFQASENVNIYKVLAIWRFILGFGVGGEYPLSATITSENADKSLRGRLLACTFSLQGFGKVLSPVIIYILLKSGANYNFVWRFALAWGGVPSALTFYFRWKMEETQEGKKAVERGKQIGQLTTLKMGFPYFWPLLLGTSINWFLQDIAFYGNGLFGSQFTAIMGLGSTLLDKTKNSLYIALIGLPGYFLTILLIDKVGRKKIQLFGYLMLGIIFIVMATQFDQLATNYKPIFLVLFALTFTFNNFGPNGTTYIIPAEIFPAEIRGTFNGISAAAGKCGAAITSNTFATISDKYGLPMVFYICSGVGAVGFIVTLIFTPDYSPEKLDEIDDNPGDRFRKLFENGHVRCMPRYLPDEVQSRFKGVNSPTSPEHNRPFLHQ